MELKPKRSPSSTARRVAAIACHEPNALVTPPSTMRSAQRRIARSIARRSAERARHDFQPADRP
eukprot:4952422-Prymnesium_polylepis.1